MAGYSRIAGADEAGRGCLAGPVVAAAVILDFRSIPKGLNDSKALKAAARERLFEAIMACAQVAVASASAR
ncbi:MAG TPA: ribonuclease HII, partial [Rhodothermales bacterium]